MTGRELNRHNDLFYLCALIEYIARTTKNRNRLIVNASQDSPKQYIKTLITVYNSWIADKIDDYNSSFYFDSADCIYQSYLIGKPL